MAGVFIMHPSIKDRLVILHHHGNDQGRRGKDYQIWVKTDGRAEVTEVIWERIQQAQNQNDLIESERFILIGENPNPKTIKIGGDLAMEFPAIMLGVDGQIDLTPDQIRERRIDNFAAKKQAPVVLKASTKKASAKKKKTPATKKPSVRNS